MMNLKIAIAHLLRPDKGRDESEQRADRGDRRKGYAIQDCDGVAGLLRQVPQVERRESPEQPGNRGWEIKI